MSAEIIKYAFVAGELSPSFYGRGDLEKFDLGLARAHNWFVDYAGGISTRPGLIFVDYVKNDGAPTRFFDFKFSPDIANTYVVLMGDGYVRFIQDGAYVLEDTGKAVTGVTKASPGVVTAVGHGFATGDWVKITGIVGMTELNGRTLEVGATTADTFALRDPFGAALNTTGFTTYVSGGQAHRIYTLTSPYDAEDLATLKADQARDQVRLTHRDYPIMNLRRVDHDEWTLTEETFEATAQAPTGLTSTPAVAGTSGVIFGVTAVMLDGTESPLSAYHYQTGTVHYGVTAGSVRLTWTPVPGAVSYNVYRSQIYYHATEMTRAAQLGFVGVAYGPEFVDNNLLPNFTITPPKYRNPFADGRIEAIEVTAGGTGYTNASAVTVTDPDGTGFVGYPVVVGGAVVAIVVENGGKGYTAPSVSVSVGSGATFDVDLGEAAGNNPAVSSVFQQRQVYAATENQPLTVWGSRPGKLSNFDESHVVVANDSYEHTVDSKTIAPIRHLIPMRGGLLVFSQAGIWQLTGTNGGPVTASDALAEPQSYAGAALVPPLTVDTDVLYVEGKGTTVRLLSYNDFSKVYAGTDMSILSNHFFTPIVRKIEAWAYAHDPFRVVWAVRSDGCLLGFTLVKEQNVFAWTQHWTQGLFRDVVTVQEDLTDATYVMVERFVNGRWSKFVEKMGPRRVLQVEDAFCVDAGLALAASFPQATLYAGAVTGTNVLFTASTNVFAVGDVGKVLWVGNGKVSVTEYVGATQIRGTFLRDATDLMPEDVAEGLRPAPAGTWTLDAPVTRVGGLHHLEGETVRVLADGNVLPDKVVSGGLITLDAPATRVVVGLGYRCIAQTLPLIAAQATIEGRKKRVVGTTVRVSDTRGLKAGESLSKLYEMKERTTESYGLPTLLQQGAKILALSPRWNLNGQTYFVQDYPLPATVLGYVLSTEVGDDPD